MITLSWQVACESTVVHVNKIALVSYCLWPSSSKSLETLIFDYLLALYSLMDIECDIRDFCVFTNLKMNAVCK